jgi:hypothetical protein
MSLKRSSGAQGKKTDAAGQIFISGIIIKTNRQVNNKPHRSKMLVEGFL